ncbi:FG-GAP repeat domain-containing protein [Streptomyces sp. NRRL F-5123]|uniref:FG-GAP repeat domain-containing protein n=1 Tax=Streptomyces sp. NRRL F-5123 TaxID=1463856 RepID=UPI000694D109|nr:VCBS repeat-containing protein [Streptomyces sp. NRRL F-5123]
MSRRLHATRLAAACALTAALTAGSLAAAGGASADPYFIPLVSDVAVNPGQDWSVSGGAYGTADGTAVYAFSKAPLTDATWADGGLPAGLTASVDGTSCQAYAGAAGVYTCPVTDANSMDSPMVQAADDAANHTYAYVGSGYAPRGTDLAAAVKAAELAGTTTSADEKTAGVISVLTEDQVALSTVQLTTPDVPLNSSVVQTAKVHAADPARLEISFGPTESERWMDEDEADVRITAVDGGPADACGHTIASAAPSGGLWCDLPPGDHTITYTLTTGPEVEAWKLVADAVLHVITSGLGNPETTSTFTLLSPDPVSERYRVLGVDKNGESWFYDGTGSVSAPFGQRSSYDAGWERYNAVTALSPLTTHGTGDVVARDASGVLWYLPGSGNRYSVIFKTPLKVGSGWSIYDTIVGARDLTGDGAADLVARDSAGTLWLYPGTASTSAPFFGGRTKIGDGWSGYRTLTGAEDLTGDGRADLLATDGSGVLWLYKGTGKAAAPYAARVKVGTGWGNYDLLLSRGDLTGDGKADFLARDTTGGLYLYQGTGDAAVPYAPRTKVGPGWTYSVIF